MEDKNIKSTEDYDLEDAMKRLDEVVEGLSCENVRLEDSLALYEEGVRLVSLCNAKLESVERKINILRTNADGELVQAPFEPIGE